MDGDPKADRRDKRLHKRRHGMLVSGRALKSVILPLLRRKAEAADKKGVKDVRGKPRQ